MKCAAALLLVLSGFTGSGCLMAARAVYRAAHPPPPHPLVAALDVNHDGVIDSAELANAPGSLRTLDKNADGRLTKDEYTPETR